MLVGEIHQFLMLKSTFFWVYLHIFPRFVSSVPGFSWFNPQIWWLSPNFWLVKCRFSLDFALSLVSSAAFCQICSSLRDCLEHWMRQQRHLQGSAGTAGIGAVRRGTKQCVYINICMYVNIYLICVYIMYK